MTLLLFRKLFRDALPSLAIVCVLVVAFSALWVKIVQRVTTEIAPFFNGLAVMSSVNPKMMDEVIYKGPGKVAQSVMGGADIRFERPADFLAVELLHPVVLTITGVWVLGRAAGAVAGEVDKGTMELLLSQPVPRGRLILAHLLVDVAAIPCVCLSVVVGTHIGLWLVGPFTVDYSILEKLTADAPLKFRPPPGPAVLEVNADRQIFGSVNHAALLFAFSGLAMLVSSCGRNRWRSTGYAVVIYVAMFVLNLVGQIWDAIGAARPLSLFFYYQPQKIWLKGEWSVSFAEAWASGPAVPVVPVLLAVGTAGYAVAYRVFSVRDLPAPL
jgi:ABC-2 type transport system permease protein